MKQQINATIKCNKDLTLASNSRVSITKSNDNEFLIQTSFKVYKCQRNGFISRFIRKKAGVPRFVVGNMSSPSGFIY